jgi:hypothetical protein
MHLAQTCSCGTSLCAPLAPLSTRRRGSSSSTSSNSTSTSISNSISISNSNSNSNSKSNSTSQRDRAGGDLADAPHNAHSPDSGKAAASRRPCPCGPGGFAASHGDLQTAPVRAALGPPQRSLSILATSAALTCAAARA